MPTKSAFPNCKVRCCRFHLGQSWYKKICKVGLKVEYSEDSDLGRWLKMFFGLAFLSPDEVPDAFVDLCSIAPQDARAEEFSDYILHTYIENATFPPELWAERPTGEYPRTTNGAESFHRHIKPDFYNSHPNIHYFLDVFKDFQAEVYIDIRSATEPTQISVKEAQKLQFVQEKYHLMKTNFISIRHFLLAVGAKYQGKQL